MIYFLATHTKAPALCALAKSTKVDIFFVDFQIPDQEIAKIIKKMGNFEKFSIISIMGHNEVERVRTTLI